MRPCKILMHHSCACVQCYGLVHVPMYLQYQGSTKEHARENRHLPSSPPQRVLRCPQPSAIRNCSLYHWCGARSLSELVKKARWGMLGCVLCIHRESPAQNTLMFTVVGSGHLRDFYCRHKTDLLDILWKDLYAQQFSLATHHDILWLCAVARDWLYWDVLYSNNNNMGG